MNPVLLQQQLKNNNQELYDICRDLKSWGEEMQKKDQKVQFKNEPTCDSVPKSSKTTQELLKEAPKKKADKSTEVKKCMSYEDWEKFDADKECDKIDEDSESELTDEIDESMKEEALVQKNNGNRFVKSGNWEEAISCYTKAIEYFAYDPVFYANRALCHIKLNQMEKAVKDCTISLKLDNTYVKAYQRRAAARESLNQLEEAKLDLLRVLEFEPKNSETKHNLEKLRMKIKSLKSTEGTTSVNRPVSKFSKSRQEKKGSSFTNETPENTAEPIKKNIDIKKSQTFWPSGDKPNLVRAIKKPPHMRSKKPLKRIPIKEINSILPIPTPAKVVQQNISSWPKKDGTDTSFKSDDINIIEHKAPNTNTDKSNNNTILPLCKKEKDVTNIDVILKSEQQKNIDMLVPPTNSVQFHMTWKKLKGMDKERYQYLRLLSPQNIPNIFKESLESQTFSEILSILAEYSIKLNDEVYEFLLFFTKIKRFSALCMFFTMNDKNCLWKMFNQIKEHESQSKEDIDALISKYEL